MITEAEYLEMCVRVKQRPIQDILAFDEAGKEIDLQEKIIEDAKHRGWWPLFSRMDLPTTTPLGTPDLILFMNHGRVIIIEAKSQTGKLRPAQLGVKLLLEKLGHEVHIVRTFKQYMEIIQLTKPNLIGSDSHEWSI